MSYACPRLIQFSPNSSEGLKLAERNNLLSAAGRLYHHLAIASQVQGNLRAAIEHLERALAIGLQLDEQVYVANRANTLGSIYRSLGRYTEGR
jgi:tetratricopeptide (TPR) repeat protein